ncbi:tigger transposable element-derived protein 1-like [Neoarius graeffei]|uniref:tigger transposable element-derived protein 1-like n=1 Tax=Neoarius graeffei TaxID=443677 RepID=UPI00298C4EDB|nr:tigger transposable element-derived protein 1-like [Neoarius graeffei]
MLKEGKSFAAVARYYGINESTVRYIKKKEQEIRKTVSISFQSSAKVVSTVRDKAIIRMESALALWISDCWKKNIPLDNNGIREKAQTLYIQYAPKGGAKEVSIEEEETEEEARPSSSSSSSPSKGFLASKGWFYWFQERYGLTSAVLHGEKASTDTEEAAKYPEKWRKIIRDGGYRPEQVFNMDETGLYWKKMPSRTYIMKEEARAPGFKAQKDRITLLMCGNAAGHMLKPGLIYKSANPRALKNKNKNALPVYWMHNKKAWVTKVLTSNWFMQSFIPQVKEYLNDLGLEFKVLLLLDNARGHPADLYYDGVKIEFLPPNTTSLLQPMDQGVIRAFKALYTRNAHQHLVSEMDANSDFTLKDYWKKFTITTCLTIIGQALKDMKKQTLNSCWKKLWPEVVNDYEGFSPSEIQHSAINRAVILAQHLGGEGFDDITEEEVGTLIDAHGDPLTDQDLEELTKSASEDEDGDKDEPEDEGLSLDRLSQILRHVREVKDMLMSWDPYMDRYIKCGNTIDSAIEPYKHLFNTLKKHQQQLPITMFFNPIKKTPEKPPEDPEEEEEAPE